MQGVSMAPGLLRTASLPSMGWPPVTALPCTRCQWFHCNAAASLRE